MVKYFNENSTCTTTLYMIEAWMKSVQWSPVILEMNSEQIASTTQCPKWKENVTSTNVKIFQWKYHMHSYIIYERYA
jgi:hypothetical protein